jgi:putative redox protein
MGIEAKVRWVDDRCFVGEASSRHGIVIDASAEKLGSSPMELVLMGTVGCTAYDVITILQKQREQVTGLEVEAVAERADQPPRVYTSIELLYTVRGKEISAKAVEHAIRLSKEKYCSASIMLGKTAEISTRYQIEEEGKAVE